VKLFSTQFIVDPFVWKKKWPLTNATYLDSLPNSAEHYPLREKAAGKNDFKNENPLVW